MAQLAIRGHATRGKEVIEILKMLGGTNSESCRGIFENRLYTINAFGIIEDKSSRDNSNYQVYTLEEFLEKFPYKIGDKVIYEDKVREVTKMVWEEQTNTVAYKLDDKLYCNVIKELQLCKEETMEEIKIDIPKGYEFAGVDDDNQQVVFTKIQPEYEYPKTFIEVLNFWHPDRQPEDDYQRCYKKDLIEKFQDLLYARDAYWKIAGEQMGLGKSWEPDWNNLSTNHEFIKINKGCFTYSSRVLVFPTEEMRDAFYENFKALINEVKELL